MNGSAFKLKLLGGFSLSGPEGEPLVVHSKKNRALLSIIALSPGLCATRAQLTSLLWSGFVEEQARSSLRQSLAVLRKDLSGHEREIVSINDEVIALHGNAVAVDALRLLEAAQNGEVAQLRDVAADTNMQLVDLAPRAEGYENWLSEQRRRLHTASIRVLEKLAELEPGAGKVEYCEKLMALDPLRESAQRMLMRAYLGIGEKGLALRQFDASAKLLRAELGVEPAAETQDLRREIIAGVQVAGLTKIEANDESDKTTLAVLPFDGLGGDAEHMFFCDGFRAEVIMELSRWKSLIVRSRFSSKPFAAGQARDLTAIAQHLNVKYLVEGSVRRSADVLRISVQLVDAENDRLAWSEKFDLKANEKISAHDRVVREIVATLVGRLRVADIQKIGRKPSTNYNAYECVLIGNALNCCVDGELLEASQLFERAVELDPRYPAALSLLAHNCLFRWQLYFDSSPKLVDQAVVHAKRAVALDESDSSGYAALSLACLNKGWFDAAVEHATRALAINPSSQYNLGDMGAILYYVGRAEDAVKYFMRAREVDAYFGPDWYWSDLGQSYMVLGRYEEALAALQRVSVPTFRVNAFRAACCARLAQHAEASDLVLQVNKQRPDFSLATFIAKEPYQLETDKLRLRESLEMAGFR